ncbi:MAG: recombination protein RecR [Gammaproteobacteria bacterium RIFCSPHIGHO2_02_FULL_42_13]|nr:MAG: recombination protein RecR [Gammaproteobacteria bacterium RIFCSPHIGHO2_02_FULL_42_13]OGT69355.1 MAG: recombination protein RecR [Gammaproteobacteria bacterium RIFCSPLOWO2_02_FULL_42_9]HLB57511.1 recombination mediator RecR [Gammaproteobacteria bacterium]
MTFSRLLDELIDALRCLPGVGPKTAQRMAFHLLERNRTGGIHLSETIVNAVKNIGHCKRCRVFSETDICQLCQNTGRDSKKLCIVESPTDIMAIEQTGIFRGYYFVLMGHLSPLDGIGPQQLGLSLLQERFKDENIQEVIISTSHTVEGEATAHYIAELAKPFKKHITRIAHGIPSGSDLEYVDGRTLANALMDRKVYI